MCPFCLTTVGLIVAGSVSTGGLAALVVKMSRKKISTNEIITNTNEWNTPDVSQHS
jgi:hypothetical protein